MELIQKIVEVGDPADVATARRQMVRMLDRVAPEIDIDAASLIITEGATNLLKHAGGGRLVLQIQPVDDVAARRAWLLCLDGGPGMADPAAAMRDGFSTAGTCGNGMGAITRQSAGMGVFSETDFGLAIHVSLRPSTVKSVVDLANDPFAGCRPNESLARSTTVDGTLQFGGLCVPHPGESRCGDGWAFVCDGGLTTLVVSDGLGHGPMAADATDAALVQLNRHRAGPPEDLLAAMHQHLSSTRGAAISVTTWDAAASTICHGGVGNVAACLWRDDTPHGWLSHNGVVGHQVKHLTSETRPWLPGDRLIVSTDGLPRSTKLRLPATIWSMPRPLIAGVLVQRYARGHDDATAVVVTSPAVPPP